MKKFCLLLLCAFLFFAILPFLYAENLETPPLESLVEQPKIVKAIQIKGNKTISDEVILSKIKTRVGQEYLQNIISDDLKRLYNSGYFSDVSVDRQDYAGGFRVIFYLTEKAIIEKISFSRTKKIPEMQLRKNLKSKEGAFLDEKTLGEDIKEIEFLYQQKGFSLASANYTTDIDAKTNKAKLHFNIDEGSRQFIKRIKVKGSQAFSSKRIIKLIKSRNKWLFNSGFFKEDVLEEDMEKIKSFYQREGFLDVKVIFTKEDVKKGGVIVTISLDEGKKYLVGSVNIQGNTVFSKQEILKVIKESLPEKAFSNERVEVDKSNIQSLYVDKGYIFAQAIETTSLDPHTSKVNITFNIKEGKEAYVDRIKIRGNIKTRDKVIRRELRIFPGDKFDGVTLRRSKERLRNLGYFEEVSYDIEPGSQENKKDLVVEVKEAKTGEFSFGGGYSSVEQVVGFVEIEQKNFDLFNFPTFTGAGQDLKVHAEIGTVRQNMFLSFTEPWIFDNPLSFGIDAYRTQHKRESDVGYGYDERRIGGDLRLGKDLSEYLHADLKYTLEEINISNIIDEASNELKKERGKNTISRLGFGLTQDSRDNIFDPTKGLLLSGLAEIAGGPFSGDKDFTRLSGKGSLDIPSILNSVLELRLRAGIVDAFGNSEEVPIYERFFSGGAYTIRGYEERKVGPLDPSTKDPIGGKSMLVGNIEYTFPLVEYIRVAGFFDSGNVWSRVSDIGNGGYKSGYGLGLRLKTPIGPVRLDYGFPLNKQPGEETRSKEGKFYFSMSHGF
ncbi:MAG: outer membrane protein assembly factor BamA [Candidatus Omnitrophota bacterium]|nr:outer membrane protein assembly factor BamA [Candidatus Omnitrophota bacterium]